MSVGEPHEGATEVKVDGWDTNTENPPRVERIGQKTNVVCKGSESLRADQGPPLGMTEFLQFAYGRGTFKLLTTAE